MRRKIELRIIIIPFLAVLFTGCVSLFPTTSFYISEELPENIVVLGDIRVDSLYAAACDPVEIKDLVRVAAIRKNLLVIDPEEDESGRYPRLDVYIHENKFSKGLNNYTSATVSITIYYPEDYGKRQIGKIIYTEDSRTSINSYRYLLKIIHKAFGYLKMKIK